MAILLGKGGGSEARFLWTNIVLLYFGTKEVFYIIRKSEIIEQF